MIKLLFSSFFTALVLASSPASAQGIPNCQLSNSDSDGDGWGWENNNSCRVVNTGASNTVAATEQRSSSTNYCLSASSDHDGDGWGWENNQSCRVGSDTSSQPVAQRATSSAVVSDVNGHAACQTANADPDGDGFGWENNNTCIVTGNIAQPAATSSGGRAVCSSASVDPDGDGWGWENGNTCIVAAGSSRSLTADTGGDTTKSSFDSPYRPEDITDLILITGQSNTLGANTTVDTNQDNPHPRVFAYTNQGWQVAELYQSWDNGSHPGSGNRDDGSRIHNNFALHFGKRLAELDGNSVIGFVLVAEPGRGISHWEPGATGMREVQQKTVAAINELPHKSSIDGILWHQGETDWILEGTSDPAVAQPARADYYPVKLSALLNNLRSENWYDHSKPFICGETIRAQGVNTHLNALNSDSDSKTACVQGFGLPSIHSGGSHFNASSLRTIGRRYAETYHSIR